MNHVTAGKLLCIALVAVIVAPLGAMILPYVGDRIGEIEFSAIEAVISTTVGYAIYGTLFG